MKKILVVAAHPDDEVLGCGGTIAKHRASGDQIKIVIFGEGPMSRGSAKSGAKKTAQNSAAQAAKILGAQSLDIFSYPDQLFENKPILEMARRVEEILRKFKADRVYTHHPKDLNKDHRRVAEAVLVAGRPLPGSSLKEIYFWETLSSSEWSYPSNSFSPTAFSNITKYLDKKLKAMKIYSHELREFPHPRSIKGITALANYRGVQSGVAAAEAFEVARSLF